ncbi:MAG TPA: hypothetical protein VHY56_02190 [Candidatus Binataceae bacterium]|nr:hypothetical protein [Candidatus Binataceae bacterium]
MVDVPLFKPRDSCPKSNDLQAQMLHLKILDEGLEMWPPLPPGGMRTLGLGAARFGTLGKIPH